MSPTHRERCDSSPLTQASTCEPLELPGGTLSEFSDLGPRAKIAQSYRGNHVAADIASKWFILINRSGSEIFNERLQRASRDRFYCHRYRSIGRHSLLRSCT